MGVPLARVGDSIKHGSTITGAITGPGSPTLQSPIGATVSKWGDDVVCALHPTTIPNIVKTTQSYTGTVDTILGAIPVTRDGDETTCGAVVVGGQTTVLIGP